MTNNADYSSVTVLLPYYGYGGLPFSILSDGAGKSVNEEFSEFSHSIYAGNCETIENIEASLKTESESGGFEWKGGAIASSYGLSMGMSVGGGIENGTLKASSGNSLSMHTEEVTANGAQYSVATSITPDTIISNGIGKGGEGLKEVEKESVSEDNGATEEESDSKEDKGSEDNEGDSDGKKGSESDDESANEGSGLDEPKKEKEEGDEHEADINENPGENTDNGSEDEDSGIFHKTRIEGQGKCAEITTNLTCDPTNTGYEWKKSAITATQNSSLGMTVEGVSKNGSLKTIEMDGEASKFPHLHLPPGEVVITTVESENNQPENNQVDISEAANDFYDDFSEKNPTVLYYKIEQECSIPIGDRDDQSQDSGIGSEEYFRLGMSFNVEQKGDG
jgi:hypothetical protein